MSSCASKSVNAKAALLVGGYRVGIFSASAAAFVDVDVLVFCVWGLRVRAAHGATLSTATMLPAWTVML